MPPTLADLQLAQWWFALPLIVSISLVYGATRHELMGPILKHAFRFGSWILGFMVVIFGILLAISALL